MKNNFKAILELKHKFPFKMSKCPEKGPNEMIDMDVVECVMIEIRGVGCGLLNGEDVGYMDIRVYNREKVGEVK